MGYERSFDENTAKLLPPCINLRSKAIYVTGNPDPQSPDEVGSTRFNCWCNKTQYVMGPDQALVERGTCTAGRACFQSRA